jgi:hypothetical protein
MPVDLSTPIMTLVVVLFTWCSLPIAFALWTLTGTAVCLWIVFTTPARPARRIMFLGAMIVAAPALALWLTGQVTWLLAVPVTLAVRSATDRRAGLWMGLAIVLKPPLALMALLVSPAVALVAAGTSIALVCASLPLVGLSAWTQWLARGHAVTWLDGLHNQSLWAWGARLALPHRATLALADFPDWLVVAIVVVALALVPLVLRATGDRRWALALLWSLAVSPLGWTYYLPLALAPAIRTLRGWPAWTALACFLVPPAALTRHPMEITYACGVISLWIGWSMASPPARTIR